MAAEWLFAATLIAVATPAFGKFEVDIQPLWVRIGRWLAYLAVAGVVGLVVGRPWTWVWLVGLPVAGATFHLIWCFRNGINPLTAEPRERYERLRRRR